MIRPPPTWWIRCSPRFATGSPPSTPQQDDITPIVIDVFWFAVTADWTHPKTQPWHVRTFLGGSSAVRKLGRTCPVSGSITSFRQIHIGDPIKILEPMVRAVVFS